MTKAQSLTNDELTAYVANHTVDELKAEVSRLMARAKDTSESFAFSVASKYHQDANALMVEMMNAGKF